PTWPIPRPPVRSADSAHSPQGARIRVGSGPSSSSRIDSEGRLCFPQNPWQPEATREKDRQEDEDAMGEIEKVVEIGKLALRQQGATALTVANALLDQVDYEKAKEPKAPAAVAMPDEDRQSTRLNSSHEKISD